MVSKEKIQTIYRFLEQPLSVEKRKEKNPPMIHPNRSMRRRYGIKKKDQTKRVPGEMASWFERWFVATAGNIQSGIRIQNAFFEEIALDQSTANRKLKESQLNHFTEIYGKEKAKKIMDDIQRKDIVISDKKMGL